MVHSASIHPHDTTWYTAVICTRSGSSMRVTVCNGFYGYRCLRYGKKKVKVEQATHNHGHICIHTMTIQ